MVVCTIDDDCPFIYICTDKLQCQHEPVFPLQLYPTLIYLLIPIGAGLVNVAGKSMGLLKVTIVMNLLRYNSTRSTALIQPMVAGSALPNIISAVFKKHPHLKTSLIDYDIILLIIPCLLGSTIGSFIEQLIPELIKDFVIIIFFISFSISFYKKSKQFSSKTTTNEVPAQLPREESNYNSGQMLLPNSESQMQRQKIKKYEQSIHLKDIILSFLAFVIFQALVFLVQGKFSFYHVEQCSWEYFFGIFVLVILVILYQEVFVRIYILSKYKKYKQLNIKRNFDLSVPKNLRIIYIVGFFAGFVQGILGVGSGTFIMGAFMKLNFHPRVAAATSCYQILFIGLAASVEQFATHNITIEQGGFFFGLTFFGGGLVTLILYWIFSKFEDRKVSKLILIIMFCLCATTAISMIPFIVQSWIQFGIKEMISVKFHC